MVPYAYYIFYDEDIYNLHDNRNSIVIELFDRSKFNAAKSLKNALTCNYTLHFLNQIHLGNIWFDSLQLFKIIRVFS